MKSVDVKDNGLTGADVRESTLTIPRAPGTLTLAGTSFRPRATGTMIIATRGNLAGINR